jgi:hypothetical protein
MPFSLTTTVYENVFRDATLWFLVHFYRRFGRSCCHHRRKYVLMEVGKGKGHPITGHQGPRGGVAV